MTTGLDTFDTTVQESNRWLKAVMDRLDTMDRHRAYEKKEYQGDDAEEEARDRETKNKKMV